MDSRVAIGIIFLFGSGVWYAAFQRMIPQTVAFFVLLVLTFVIRVILSKSQ